MISSTINRRIEELAEELGEEINYFLGTGSFGYSFKTKSGKVLKITSDENEAHLAYKLSKNKNWFKYLVNYYNVGLIDIGNKDIGLDSNNYKWYILMDYVEDLNKEEKLAVDSYKSKIQYKPNYMELILDKDKVMSDIESLYSPEGLHYRKIKSSMGKDPEKIKEIAIDIYPKILNIAKDLKKHGIKETDFHGVMLDGIKIMKI